MYTNKNSSAAQHYLISNFQILINSQLSLHKISLTI